MSESVFFAGVARKAGSYVLGSEASLGWRPCHETVCRLRSPPFPALRDQFVAAILSGGKTTTTALADYEREGEPLPRPGLRQAVVDSAGHRVAVIETTAVRVIRLGDIDLAHALGEGEGYNSVAEWRAGHERFWHSAEVRSEVGDPEFTVDDDTLVVTQTFSLLEP